MLFDVLLVFCMWIEFYLHKIRNQIHHLINKPPVSIILCYNNNNNNKNKKNAISNYEK